MPYIYSTLTSSQRYQTYTPSENGIPSAERPSILIQGGTNVADKNFVTPRGVVTKVTADQVKELQQNKLFQTHVKNGYITIEDKEVEKDKVAADLTQRSPDAPLVPEDFKDGKAPETNKKSK
jgi:hypothetical protein